MSIIGNGVLITEKVTKRQHFVPKMYLKRFIFDGKNCYTLNHKNEIHCQNIREICWEKDLYELRNVYGEVVKRNLIEKEFFDKLIERGFTPFFDGFLGTVDEDQSAVEFLKREENRTCLILFMGSLLLRNKTTIDQTIIEEQGG